MNDFCAENFYFINKSVIFVHEIRDVMQTENIKLRNKEQNNSGHKPNTSLGNSIEPSVPQQGTMNNGVCPHCGATNEVDAMFCEQCGTRLRDQLCPHCGAVLDDKADFCENCNHYIDAEHCPYCYALVGEEDTFCPECGVPFGGIECPVCHTVGQFGFCASCGTPLTDSARRTLNEVWKDNPVTEELRQLENELEQLWMVCPVTSERQRVVMQNVQSLCQRVKELMAQEDEHTYEVNDKSDEKASQPIIMDESELNDKILAKQQALQALLDSMQTKMAENPAIARNYAMACKPHVSRLAWKCNYKHALHLTPLACACPHLGGKWVVTDGKNEL